MHPGLRMGLCAVLVLIAPSFTIAETLPLSLCEAARSPGEVSLSLLR